MLIEEGELLRWWWRFQPDSAPVANVVHLAEARYLLHGRVRERRGQVRPLAVGALVPGHTLRPVKSKHAHEVLARPVTQVQHAAPQPGGSGVAGCPDDCLDLIRPVGKSGQDGSQ